MLAYFAETHSSLVHDVSTLISDGFSVSQSKDKYNKKRIHTTLNEVASFASNARSNVLAASIAISQSAGPNEFTAILTNIEELLNTEKKCRKKDAKVAISEKFLSRLYQALEDVVSLLSNEALKAQTDQSTFVDISEKLEVASSQIARASILVLDCYTAKAQKKKLSYPLSNVVDGIRRATYITACSLMDIYKQHIESTDLEDFTISPTAIHSAVLIANLISVKTPNSLRERASKIAINMFSAIKESCSKLACINQSNTYDNVSGTLDSALSIILELATEYAEKNSAKKSHKKSTSQGTPGFTPLKMLELLLREGMYHSNYAIHLYNTPENHKAHSEETKSKILAHLEEIKDSLRQCIDSHALVLETEQIGPNFVNVVKSLRSTVSTAELLYDVIGQNNLDNNTSKLTKFTTKLSYKTTKKKQNNLDNNTSRFIDTTVICALRSLDIALDSQTSYKCIWGAYSPDVLPVFAKEIPEALKGKDKLYSKKAKSFQWFKAVNRLMDYDEFHYEQSKRVEKLELQTCATLRWNKPEVACDAVVKSEGESSDNVITSNTSKQVSNMTHASGKEEYKSLSCSPELRETLSVDDVDLDSPDSSLEEAMYASVYDSLEYGGGEAHAQQL